MQRRAAHGPTTASAEMLDSKTVSAELPLVPMGAPGAAFRLQLRPEPEAPGIGMLRVKHVSGFRRLPTPRAGDNPVRVAGVRSTPPAQGSSSPGRPASGESGREVGQLA